MISFHFNETMSSDARTKQAREREREKDEDEYVCTDDICYSPLRLVTIFIVVLLSEGSRRIFFLIGRNEISQRISEKNSTFLSEYFPSLELILFVHSDCSDIDHFLYPSRSMIHSFEDFTDDDIISHNDVAFFAFIFP